MPFKPFTKKSGKDKKAATKAKPKTDNFAKAKKLAQARPKKKKLFAFA